MVEPSTPATARSSRRSVLRILCRAGAGVGAVGVAGCLSRSPGTPTGTRTTAPPTGSQGEPPSPTGTTADPTNEVLELTVHPVAEAPTPFQVYAPTLADWLRRAADGETVRAHAEVQFPMSHPVLPEFDGGAIELVDAGDRSGTYEVIAAGGTRYHVLAGAETVESPPDDVEVIDYDSLVAGRRELVRLAIRGDPDARFYQETPLGEWARTEFLGGYVEYEGDVYRGHEVQQTDAAFFSREVWVVCSLRETDSPGSEPWRVSLAETPEAVRTRVDQVYSKLQRDSTSASMEVPDLVEAVESYAESTAGLLSVTRAFELTVTESASEN